MNPFERLRHTIERVNITYQFPEQESEMVVKTAGNPNTYTSNVQKTMSATNNDELERIKQICQNQQFSAIRDLNQMSNKVEELQKKLKRAETVIHNQMNQIVDLQKENEQLKANLTQHYSSVVQGDDKERKYKEEIHRINITINELAIQIQSERNAKKILINEVQNVRKKLQAKNNELEQFKAEAEKQKARLTSQLEERIQMFEYNVKKASEDRKQYKLALSAAQQNNAKVIQAYKSDIDKLKQEVSDTKKALEIQSLHRKNIEDSLTRERTQYAQVKDDNRRVSEQLANLRQQLDESQRSKDNLEKNISSLGSELAEEKKNMKVKVIEVRDETLNMELQMYKRQCKELLQERFLMKSMAHQEGVFESEYKILSGQEASSV